MANDFRIGDWVNWKFGDGSPDQIVSFGWQRQTAFLSRQAKIGVPVTELSPAKAPEVVNEPKVSGWKLGPDGSPEKIALKTAWTPAPPKGH